MELPEDDLTYASLLGEDSDKEPTTTEELESALEVADAEEVDEEAGSEEGEKLILDDFSLDEETLPAESGKEEEIEISESEFSLGEDEEGTTGEFTMPDEMEAEGEEDTVSFADLASKGEDDGGIVISMAGEEEEDDFLRLADEEGPQKEDSGPLGGVADVGKTSLAEVLLEGIEMDIPEQVSSVTKVELLLAQGKEKEAADLLKHIADRKGVTPWVSKRLNKIKKT